MRPESTQGVVMSDTMERFDPSAWHDKGVMHSLPPAPKRHRDRRVSGGRRAPIVATFALATAAFFLGDTSLSFAVDATAASKELESVGTARRALDGSADYIDPSEWGVLMSVLDKLPRDYTEEPDDVEPFL